MKLGYTLFGWIVKLENVDIHKCDKCPKAFLRLEDLMKHEEYHNKYFFKHATSAYVRIEKIKIYDCEKCIQSFNNKKKYVLHRINHIQKNVVQIKKLSKLPENQPTNYINKPYKCPDCDFEFVARSTLEEHSIVHQPFPNICECGIGYYKKHDLILHRKLVHSYRPTKENSNKDCIKVRTKTLPDILAPKESKPVSPNKIETHNRKKRKTSSLKKSGKHKKTGAHKKPVSKETQRLSDKELEKISEDSENKSDKKALKSENKSIKTFKNKVGERRERIKQNGLKITKPDIEIEVLDDKRAVCPICKKIFMNKRNVYIHYVVHSGERPYECVYCGKRFTQTAALKKHERYAHTNVNNDEFPCSTCGKTFKSPQYRDRHELIHGEKQYECPTCNKAFHDPSALKRHKRIHTGDKIYHCPYCPKAFTDISGLRGHKLRHENKKNFVCEHCEKRFYTLTDLKKHTMIIHNLEKRYCCDICKKWFALKGYLMIHMVSYHLRKKLKQKH